jgi:NIMA (never in mitosis gene a)-related kinase 1/4/5
MRSAVFMILTSLRK